MKLKTLALLMLASFASISHAEIQSGGEWRALINNREAVVPVHVDGRRFYIEARDALIFGALEPTGRVYLEDVEVDSGELTLKASLPAALLPLQRVGRRDPLPLAEPVAGAGWLNYRAVVQRSASGTQTNSLLLDATASLPLGWLFRHTHIAGDGAASRLFTAVEKDFHEKMLSVSLGDAYSSSSGLAGGVKFAGVQLRKNYALDPYYIYAPTLSLAGEARARSVYEVWHENQKLQSGTLERGEFSFENFRGIDESGNVRVIVRDAQGGEQVITADLFSAPGALRDGELSYAVDAGLAYAGNDPKEKYAAAGLRYGWRGVTLEAGADYMSGASGTLGLIVPSRIGSFYARTTRGKHGLDDEHITRFGFNRRLAVRDDAELRFAIDSQRGTDVRHDTASVSYSQSNGLSAYATFSRAGRDNVFTTGFSKLVHAAGVNMNVGVQLSRAGDENRGAVFVSLPLGRSHSAYVRASNADDSSAHVFGSLRDFRYSARADEGRRYSAQASYSGSLADARVSVNNSRAGTGYRGEVAGALVFAGTDVALAPPVRGTLLLVEDAAGAAVMASGRQQRIALGDRQAVVGLPAHYETEVRPALDQLPAGWTAESDRERLRLPRGASQIAMRMRPPGFFAQIAVDGKPLERGTRISANEDQVVIGSAGAYIQPQAGQQQIKIKIGLCAQQIEIPKTEFSSVPLRFIGC